ncbi:hypothetical protein SteCoe_14668 [Stentor coeruleus]|uniref:RGS domain-containing protein n=1 Tax=Stentor coeruleus TaxID=5963 RepID=A0A1R2C5I0_9CILI|nr:hypothetical protein SteCoe_14668 [Stentor coeruleus]
MAYPPFPLEAAFRQDIDSIAESEDLQFAKKHFLFVSKYKCSQEKQTQQCIEDGRNLYSQFVHGTKIAKQKTLYCLSGCKDESCYEQCKDSLRSTLSGLTSKIDPIMNDYLLSFAPK